MFCHGALIDPRQDAPPRPPATRGIPPSGKGAKTAPPRKSERRPVVPLSQTGTKPQASPFARCHQEDRCLAATAKLRSLPSRNRRPPRPACATSPIVGREFGAADRAPASSPSTV